MDWPLTLGMGTFPAGPCFALEYIIITLGSVPLELVDSVKMFQTLTGGNHDLHTLCQKKDDCLKFCEVVL